MKDKTVAGILALFVGWLGIHRFYLGQIGRGILYLIFCWFPGTWLLALIDAIVLLSMKQERFDEKYNTSYSEKFRSARKPDFDRYEEYKARRKGQFQKPEVQKATNAKTTKTNPYKLSGLKKFKEYDYQGAIEDFNKSIELAPDDVATHFNLACAYSLLENTELAFRHLDIAMANGFRDMQRIREHPALAYLRIQSQFKDFADNGFRLRPALPANRDENLLDTPPNLLDQLKKLRDLRTKGLLTQQEFDKKKRELLG